MRWKFISMSIFVFFCLATARQRDAAQRNRAEACNFSPSKVKYLHQQMTLYETSVGIVYRKN